MSQGNCVVESTGGDVLYSVQGAAHCTVYKVQCTVQCTLYTVQLTVQFTLCSAMHCIVQFTDQYNEHS